MIPGIRIPETAAEAALQRVEGIAMSYVTHHGATIGHVTGQYRSAQIAGASPDTIKAAIRKAMTTPLRPDAARVAHLTNLFLS
jgi:hypothetical protein